MEEEFIANFVKTEGDSNGNIYWTFSNGVVCYVIMFLKSQRNRISATQIISDGYEYRPVNALQKILSESFNQDAIFADEDMLIAEAERLMQLCFQEYSNFVSKILMKGGFKCN